MLTRLAASILSVLLMSTAADARHFAQPPNAPVQANPDDGAMPVPMPIPTPDRAAVRTALAARRAHNLASFRTYRLAGVYPHNFTRPGALNVWFDAEGHLCAAATMIDKDGKHQLVQDTARDHNQIRLLDVTEGPLMDWILTSGLTVEEIDRIQAPMVAPEPELRQQEWRIAEDARLRTLYAQTDRWLAKHARLGLDAAVSRLMANPELAQKLLDGPR